MPLYEYQCTACGKRTEVLQRFEDAPPASCPACGGAVKKLVSSPAFQFKGSGWYVTDYARKGGGAAQGESASSAADGVERPAGSERAAGEDSATRPASSERSDRSDGKPGAGAGGAGSDGGSASKSSAASDSRSDAGSSAKSSAKSGGKAESKPAPAGGGSGS